MIGRYDIYSAPIRKVQRAFEGFELKNLQPGAQMFAVARVFGSHPSRNAEVMVLGSFSLKGSVRARSIRP
ncbi:MAG: hypothetical protein DMG57_36130 [Acidobacteria bacterium]|nr:MAG: hypothetical protein DMG57_36130 [Acidobacteriota bacterium]